MALSQTVINAIVFIIVLLIVGIGVYFFLHKKGKDSQDSKGKKDKASLSKSSKGQLTVSGHYYLKSVSNNKYLDKNGNFHDSIQNANSFYVNVQTNVMDPMPVFSSISSAPNSVTRIYLTPNGGILGVQSPNQPINYVSVGPSGNLTSTTASSLNMLSSQNAYLFQFIASS